MATVAEEHHRSAEPAKFECGSATSRSGPDDDNTHLLKEASLGLDSHGSGERVVSRAWSFLHDSEAGPVLDHACKCLLRRRLVDITKESGAAVERLLPDRERQR